VSDIKTVRTCPLGATCEQIVDGRIERCAWFTKIEGNHPQTGEFMSESRCSMEWLPLLNIDLAGKLNETIASVQSLRNETVKRQDEYLEVVKNAPKIISSN
jgi:hypothetical protein